MFLIDHINRSPGFKLIWARFGKIRFLLLGLPTGNRRHLLVLKFHWTTHAILNFFGLLRQQFIITTYVDTQCAFSSKLCLWPSCSICFLQSPCISQRLHLCLKLIKEASLQCKFALAPQENIPHTLHRVHVLTPLQKHSSDQSGL